MRLKLLATVASLLVACSSMGAPREASTVGQDYVVFNATNKVVKVADNHPAKVIGYVMDAPAQDSAVTNVCTVTATRIGTLIDRSSTNAPTVTTWTNLYTIATITTTNVAANLDSQAISSSFYSYGQDSLTYSNSALTNAVLNLQWQY